MALLGRTAGRDVVASGVFIGEMGSTYELIIADEIDVTIYIDFINVDKDDPYTEWFNKNSSSCNIEIAINDKSLISTGNYASIDIKSDEKQTFLFNYTMTFLAEEGGKTFYSCIYSVFREFKK